MSCVCSSGKDARRTSVSSGYRETALSSAICSCRRCLILMKRRMLMKREKRKVEKCYLLLAPFNEKFDVLLAFSRPSAGPGGQSVYPSKMKITGVPPPPRRREEEIAANYVPTVSHRRWNSKRKRLYRHRSLQGGYMTNISQTLYE